MTALVRWLGVLVATAGIVACTAQPPAQVLLRPDVTASLPGLPTTPTSWHASQLLTVQAQGREEQLSVEIELSDGKLTVIAFTTWGARVLTVTYDGRSVVAEATGPAPVLPPPPQVIADVLLVNWRITSWTLPPGWRLDQQLDYRRMRDAGSRVVTEVRYPPPESADDVLLINHAYGYRLSIRTLAGDAPVR